MINRMIRVNPKYRASGTTSNFIMDFSTQEVQEVRAVGLLDATLNRLFPNIYAPINRFILRYVDGGFVVHDARIIIPAGQYTATTLATAMTSALVAFGAVTAGITVTFNATTNRFNFLWNGAGGAIFIQLVPFGTSDPVLQSSETELAPYIGLMTFATLPPATPTDVTSPPSLEGPDEVYIESQYLCGASCVDVPFLGSSIPYLGKISFTNVPYGFTGTYQSTQAELQQINYKRDGVRNLSNFDIRLTDRYGNTLDIPDNCYIDMHLVVYVTP